MTWWFIFDSAAVEGVDPGICYAPEDTINRWEDDIYGGDDRIYASEDFVYAGEDTIDGHDDIVYVVYDMINAP